LFIVGAAWQCTLGRCVQNLSGESGPASTEQIALHRFDLLILTAGFLDDLHHLIVVESREKEKGSRRKQLDHDDFLVLCKLGDYFPLARDERALFSIEVRECDWGRGIAVLRQIDVHVLFEFETVMSARAAIGSQEIQKLE
ncbi:hypothetical protein PMAYCL1PPCAC_08770, partial [Pristionchus mayeri]